MAGRPRVGVTGNGRRWSPSWWCTRWALKLAGAEPERISVRHAFSGRRLDALIIGGGDDIGPEHYDGDINKRVRSDPARDRLEIDWIEAEGDYMKFHVGGKSHLMRETMAKLEARLDPKRFVRIHRSTIVNLDRVRKLSPSFVGEYAVVLQDGTKLKLSRGYQDKLQSHLKALF